MEVATHTHTHQHNQHGRSAQPHPIPFTSICVRFANGEAIQIARKHLPETARVSGYPTVRDLKEAVAERLSLTGFPGVDDAPESVGKNKGKTFPYIPPTLIEFLAHGHYEPPIASGKDDPSCCCIVPEPDSSASLDADSGGSCGSTYTYFLSDHYLLSALAREDGADEELSAIVRGTSRDFSGVKRVSLPGPRTPSTFRHRGDFLSFLSITNNWPESQQERIGIMRWNYWRFFRLDSRAQLPDGDLTGLIFPPSEENGYVFPVILTRREFARETIYMTEDEMLCGAAGPSASSQWGDRLLVHTGRPPRREQEDEEDDQPFFLDGHNYVYEDSAPRYEPVHYESALSFALAEDPHGAAMDVLKRLRMILRGGRDSLGEAPATASQGGNEATPASASLVERAASALDERWENEEGDAPLFLLWRAAAAGYEAFLLEALTAASYRPRSDSKHLFGDASSPSQQTRPRTNLDFEFDLFQTLHSFVIFCFCTTIFFPRDQCPWCCFEAESGVGLILKLSRSARIWAAVLNRPELRTRSKAKSQFFDEPVRAAGDISQSQSGLRLLLDADRDPATTDFFSFSLPPLAELMWERIEKTATQTTTCASWYAVLAVFFASYLHDVDSGARAEARDLRLQESVGARRRLLVKTLEKYLFPAMDDERERFSEQEWTKMGIDLIASLIVHLRYLIGDLTTIVEKPFSAWRKYSNTAETVCRFLFYNLANASLISDPIRREMEKISKTTGDALRVQRRAWVRDLLRKLRALLANLQHLWSRLGCEQHLPLTRTDELLRHFRKLGAAQSEQACNFIYEIRNAQGDQKAWNRGEGIHNHSRPPKHPKRHYGCGGRCDSEYADEEHWAFADLPLKDVRSRATEKRKDRARRLKVRANLVVKNADVAAGGDWAESHVSDDTAMSMSQLYLLAFLDDDEAPLVAASQMNNE